jgi:hypothetical protein
LLVYGYGCRRSEYGDLVDVSIPLALVAPQLVATLYRTGRTTSDPKHAAQIAFGRGPKADRAVDLVTKALKGDI